MLVLHAWWGLNNTIKSVCKQLADAGFVAFAPDLYHGKVADTLAGAEVLAKTLDANASRAKAEVREAAAFTSERARHHDRGLAVIGFSLGAYYALDVSTTDAEDVRRVVIFYGTGRGDFSRSKAAYLGHFARKRSVRVGGRRRRVGGSAEEREAAGDVPSLPRHRTLVLRARPSAGL